MSRAERRRRNTIITKRRSKYVFSIFNPSHPVKSAYRYDETEYNQKLIEFWSQVRCRLGKCKVMHPFDCGHTQCFVCGQKRKMIGITKQEILSLVNLREQMQDV